MLSDCLALLTMLFATTGCLTETRAAEPLRVDTARTVVDPVVEPEISRSGPSVRRDVLLVGGATAIVTLLNPDVRRGVFTEGSLSHVVHNFRHPVRRAIEGGREDDDAFIHNRVAHPISWGGMGYYLRRQGYSRPGALLFTQAHSVVWEYVIEGSYQKPSGKDLVTNFVSSAAAILLFPDGLSPSTDPPGLSYEIAFRGPQRR